VSRFPAAFRPPAFASCAILSRRGVLPSSRSAYQPMGWTSTGFPRSARMSPDRGGCLLDPGAVVPTRSERNIPTSTCRFPAASPTPLPPATIRRGPQSRGINEGSRDSPVRSSSRPYSPG